MGVVTSLERGQGHPRSFVKRQHTSVRRIDWKEEELASCSLTGLSHWAVTLGR